MNEKNFMLDLDCSVRCEYEDTNIAATNLWFENNTIVVRWVDDYGSDLTSNLLEEDEELIWDIIKSIKR